MGDPGEFVDFGFGLLCESVNSGDSGESDIFCEFTDSEESTDADNLVNLYIQEKVINLVIVGYLTNMFDLVILVNLCSNYDICKNFDTNKCQKIFV